MTTTFTVTDNAEEIGTYTWDGTEWQWHGDARVGPVIANRTMNRVRRAAYLPTIGLPADADQATELARTWGIRATDAIEFVPQPEHPGIPTRIPVRGGGLRNGATATITGGTAAADGEPVAGLPRSLAALTLGSGPLTATVEVHDGGRTFLVTRACRTRQAS